MADTQPDVTSRLHALLFSAGEPVSLKSLVHSLEVPREELDAAIQRLSEQLSAGPVQLIQTDTHVGLAVSEPLLPSVRKAQEKELGKEIGDAGLEVLSILLYRGSSTRAQIDYIRGVNTSSTMRNLLTRGLIERVGNPEDGREYLYRPSIELLAYLGVKSTHELPDYGIISSELASFSKTAPGPFTEHGNSSNNLHNGEGLQQS
jgi:segregation and condensation protein B